MAVAVAVAEPIVPRAPPSSISEESCDRNAVAKASVGRVLWTESADESC